ncbi:hypothetical protein DL240_03280 [Lujinxingia litoralis]|uniref:Uncharacterized protein n=2 Tax=Lujinxingia litoralis TaxID=2211119 RepID=A0A328C9E2_9DELT|nr:hypothetical protein DL240_03280 [Lujinxingia litoralis]
MFFSTHEAINLYQQGNGSMDFCLADIATKAERAGLGAVCAQVEQAQAACSRSQRLDEAWANTRHTGLPSRGAAAKTDVLIDRTVKQISDIAQTFASMHRDSPRKVAGQRLVDRVFPRGVFPITSQRFEEQRVTVDLILERLQGELADDIALLGLIELVEDLSAYNKTFGEQLSVHDDLLTFDRVADARLEAREAYAGVIVMILAGTLTNKELRAELLASVRDQQGRLAQHYRRRGKIAAVDRADEEVSNEPLGEGDDIVVSPGPATD